MKPILVTNRKLRNELFSEWCTNINHARDDAGRTEWVATGEEVLSRLRSSHIDVCGEPIGERLFAVHNSLLSSLMYSRPRFALSAMDAESELAALVAQTRLNQLWEIYDWTRIVSSGVSDSICTGLGVVKIGMLGPSTDDSEATRPYLPDSTATEYVLEDKRITRLNGGMNNGKYEAHAGLSVVRSADLFFEPISDRRMDNSWFAQRIYLPLTVAKSRLGWNAKAREALCGVTEKEVTVKPAYYTDHAGIRRREEAVSTTTAMPMAEVWEYYDLTRNLWGAFTLIASKEELHWLVSPRVSPFVDTSPYYLFSAWDFQGSPYPIGELSKCVALARERERFLARGASDVKAQRRLHFVHPSILADDDSRKKLESGKENEIIPFDSSTEGSPIITTDPVAADPNNITMADRIDQEIDRIAGVNIYRTNPASLPSRTTATVGGYIANAADSQAAARSEATEAAMARLAFAVLALEAEFGEATWVVDMTDSLDPEIVAQKKSEEADAPKDKRRFDNYELGRDRRVYGQFKRDMLRGRWHLSTVVGSTQAATPLARRQNAINFVQSLAPFMQLTNETGQPLVDVTAVVKYLVDEGFELKPGQFLNLTSGQPALPEGSVPSLAGVGVAPPGAEGPGSGQDALPPEQLTLEGGQ